MKQEAVAQPIEPVEYEGKKVTPGRIHDFQSGRNLHLVDEGANHYVVLNDEKKPTRMSKAHENKFFRVDYKHRIDGDPSRAVNETHLHGAINAKQKALIVGTDIEGSVKDHVSEGAHADEGKIAPFFIENAKGKRVFIKPGDPNVDAEILGHAEQGEGFSQAHREVAYHNAMQNVFGLGEHVPTTVGFKVPGSDNLWTAQEYRPGKHLPMNGKGNSTLSGLHAGGTTQKMAVADWILGNEDRHVGNFLVEPESNRLHLIDHGSTFKYGDLYHSRPDYIQDDTHQLPFDQTTHDWVSSLKQDKLKNTLQELGVPERHQKGALDRLDRIQSAVLNREPISSQWLEHPGFRIHQ